MKVIKKYTELVQRERTEKFLFWINLFFVPFLVIVIPDTIRFGLRDPLLYRYIINHLPLYLLTYLFFLLLHFAITLLVKRIAISQIILCILSCVAAFAHYNKVLYRSEPLFLSDIFQMFDALEVVNNGVKVEFSASLIFYAFISLLLFFAFLPVRLPLFKRTKSVLLRFGISLFTILLIAFYTKTVLFNTEFAMKLGMLYEVNITTAYDQNTFYLQFININQYLFHSAPNGYSKEVMQDIAKDISEYESSNDGVKADIILVEVESWFRFDNYDVTFERDPFASVDSLQGVISGNVVTPKYGGGTSFMEYEALTAFSSANDSGSGTSPFNIYVYPDFPSIVNYVDTLGYRTVSLHSYNNGMYNRKHAYPYLGFRESYFDDSFSNPERYGLYISDDACFQKAIELYEETPIDGNVFIHVLTMQNHINVFSDRFSDESQIIKTNGSAYTEEQLNHISYFASLMEKSNLAITDFIKYMEDNAERPVIIVFFGDHQTAITPENATTDILTATGFFENGNSFETYYSTHITPYVIWSNIDVNDNVSTFGNLAPNTLLTKTLNYYNCVRPSYFDYLLNSTTTFKGVSGGAYLNNDGSLFYSLNEKQLEEQEKRTLIEYDIIWGKKYLFDALTQIETE